MTSRPLAGETVVGPERHDRVDFEQAGSDKRRHLQHRAGRLLVLGFNQQALAGSVTSVPNLANDPSLAEIADKPRFGFQAAMEIDFATQLRAAAGKRQILHGDRFEEGFKKPNYPTQ